MDGPGMRKTLALAALVSATAALAKALAELIRTLSGLG